MTDVYKFPPALMRERFDDAAAKLGTRPMLATFVESTRKIVAVPGGYRRFGPYWWAVKAVLKNNGVDLGGEDCTWLREEYSARLQKGGVDQENTLLAAWIYSEGNTFNPETEFEIDGVMWIVADSDMS